MYTVFNNFKNLATKFIIPALAIIGIILSIELNIVYFNANFVQGAKASFCAVNSVVNCDAVAQTQYSSFFGIPLSIYGLGFYFTILVLSIIPFINRPFAQDFKNPKSYIFTLSTVSVGISIALAWISVMLIHKICILCYITYFVNLFIFLVSKVGNGFMEHYKNTIKDTKEILTEPLYRLLAVILVVIVTASLYYFNTSKVLIARAENNLFSGSSTPEYVNKKPGNILGSRNPKLVINEYTDFECGFCAISNLMMHRLVMEVPDVQVRHNDFPLGSECNPQINNTAHKNSCLAALYSHAAVKQGKQWELTNFMFENQRNLTEADILKYAKNMKFDIKKLQQDAHDPQTKQKLKADINNAIKKGIDATPTYFIGNKKYVGLMPYEKLRETVVEHLKKTK